MYTTPAVAAATIRAETTTRVETHTQPNKRNTKKKKEKAKYRANDTAARNREKKNQVSNPSISVCTHRERDVKKMQKEKQQTPPQREKER
jgi:hypothetical protein